MFAGIALGEIFRTASPNDGQELHLNFLHEVLEAFRLVGELLQDPFGKLRSGKIAEFERHMGKSFDYAEEVVVEVIESMNAGNVNEYNNSSFMSKLLADGQGLEDVKAAVMALLQAGVDTTGKKLLSVDIDVLCIEVDPALRLYRLLAVLESCDVS